MNRRTTRLWRAPARRWASSAQTRSRISRRAATCASKIGRSSEVIESSSRMIFSARRAKPPTRFPNRTPNVLSRPRVSFSSRTRMACQGVARGEQRPHDIGAMALDPDSLRPAGADDLGEAAHIVPVGLVRHHLQHAMGVAHVEADDRQSLRPAARSKATPRAARSSCPPSGSRPTTARATPRSRPGRSAPCPPRGSSRRRRRQRSPSAPAPRPELQTRPCHPPSIWRRRGGGCRYPSNIDRRLAARAGRHGDYAKWCGRAGLR